MLFVNRVEFTKRHHSLIAIMLGRLEMDIDQCITAYNQLMKMMFEEMVHEKRSRFPGRSQLRFDSVKLKVALEEMFLGQGYSPTEPLNNGQVRGCKVYVLAQRWTLSSRH